MVYRTAREIGNQNPGDSTFFSFIMCLTANNVQWIKSPVWRSRDNSDENTAKHLPPTVQFKAHGSNMSAQVWRKLSAWLILPGPWQIVPLHAAASVTLWSKQPACCLSWRKVYTGKQGWSAVNATRLVSWSRCAVLLYETKGCRAFLCCWNRVGGQQINKVSTTV